MTTFPGSPRPIKVALVGVDPRSPRAGTMVFQHNPDTIYTKRMEN